MNTVTRYKCDLCGRSFSDEDKCAEHEGTHLLPEDFRVSSAIYAKPTTFSAYGPWPESVTLAATDGSGRRASFYFNYIEDAE